MKKVIILGIDAAALDETKAAISSFADIRTYAGMNLKDFRTIFAENEKKIDYVFMGGGMPLEERLTIMKETVEGNPSASVFNKDATTRAEGFAPWVRCIVDGLETSGYTTVGW